MELKVKVGGILRVVCGVSENTTCQDVVIALAHAMGKTGRFTLVEKWRENERLLLPKDCPVQILQKWGEYASEVQFLLKQSDDTDKHKDNSKENDKAKNMKSKEAGEHNVVRRSLTFSGAHNTGCNLSAVDRFKAQRLGLSKVQSLDNDHSVPNSHYRNHTPIDFKPQDHRSLGFGSHGAERLQNPNISNSHSDNSHFQTHLHNRVSKQDEDNLGLPRQKTHARKSPLISDNVTTRKSPAPYPSALQNQGCGAYPQHRTEHNRVTSPGAYSRALSPGGNNRSDSRGAFNRVNLPGGQVTANPQQSFSDQSLLSDNVSDHANVSILPSVQNRTNRPSAFQPVIPHSKQLSNEQLDLTQPHRSRGVSVPGYNLQPAVTVATDVEEYDLDSNFPDILRDSRGDSRKENVLIEEYRMPGDDDPRTGHSKGLVDDPQVVKMQRLITMQQERIEMQESQLQMIDTELASLEDKDRQILDQQHSIGEEVVKLQQQYNQNEAELVQLDAVKWVDVIETEKSKDKRYSTEISNLKVRLETCEGDLGIKKSKITELDSKIIEEQTKLSDMLQKQQSDREQAEKEMEEIQQKIDSKEKQCEADKSSLTAVEEELDKLDKKIDNQKKEVETLEKNIKDVNMQSFTQPSGEGKALLKVLEGRQSPRVGLSRKFVTSPLSKVLSVSKNPNGVWV